MSGTTLTVQKIAETGQTPSSPTLDQHWQSVDRLAAVSRLNLVQRYQTDYNRLDMEFSNLRVSRVWLASVENEATDELLMAYVHILASYLRQRGLFAELLRWCEDGLQACERQKQNPGWLLLLKSKAQNMLGHWTDSEASIQAAITASQGEDLPTHAQAVLALGRLWFNQGHYKTALQTLAQAETLLAAQSDYEGVATVRVEMAAYHLNRGELDQALALYLEVDQLRKQAGAPETADHTLMMLGVVYRKKEDYKQAAAYLQQLLARGQVQRNRGAIATAAHHLAWVHLNQGDVAEARRLCGQAITFYEEIGDLRGVSDAYEQLGLIALAEGKNTEALSHLEQSLTLRRQLGNQHGAASSLRHLAVAHFHLRHLATGVRLAGKSLLIYFRLGVLSRQRLMAMGREFLDWVVGQRRWTM